MVASTPDGFSTPGAPFTIAKNGDTHDGTWRHKNTLSNILSVMKSNTARAQEDIAKATQLLLRRIPHEGSESNAVQSALDSNITLALRLQNGVTHFITFTPADNDTLIEKFSHAASLANDWGQVHRKSCENIRDVLRTLEQERLADEKEIAQCNAQHANTDQSATACANAANHCLTATLKSPFSGIRSTGPADKFQRATAHTFCPVADAMSADHARDTPQHKATPATAPANFSYAASVEARKQQLATIQKKTEKLAEAYRNCKNPDKKSENVIAAFNLLDSLYGKATQTACLGCSNTIGQYQGLFLASIMMECDAKLAERFGSRNLLLDALLQAISMKTITERKDELHGVGGEWKDHESVAEYTTRVTRAAAAVGLTEEEAYTRIRRAFIEAVGPEAFKKLELRIMTDNNLKKGDKISIFLIVHKLETVMSRRGYTLASDFKKKAAAATAAAPSTAQQAPAASEVGAEQSPRPVQRVQREEQRAATQLQRLLPQPQEQGGEDKAARSARRGPATPSQ